MAFRARWACGTLLSGTCSRVGGNLVLFFLLALFASFPCLLNAGCFVFGAGRKWKWR